MEGGREEGEGEKREKERVYEGRKWIGKEEERKENSC